MARRKDVAAPSPAFVDMFADRDPVAPESYHRSQSQPNIDWAGLVSRDGENRQFTAQTPNGTLHESGNGANQNWSWGPDANGARWSGRVNWNKSGRVNRTGE